LSITNYQSRFEAKKGPRVHVTYSYDILGSFFNFEKDDLSIRESHLFTKIDQERIVF